MPINVHTPRKKLGNIKGKNGLITNVRFVDRIFGARIEDMKKRDMIIIKTYLCSDILILNKSNIQFHTCEQRCGQRY